MDLNEDYELTNCIGRCHRCICLFKCSDVRGSNLNTSFAR